MRTLKFSFIIPVYNRPQEIKELLESFLRMEGDFDYEIVIVEDGSQITSKDIIGSFTKLNISYYSKPNSGPGDSRNFGMKHAKGNYFIILDSDVIVPKHYLKMVAAYLEDTFYHCYGGPDAADDSFTSLQKAINFSMTSFLTTGGIRGSEKPIKDFQPRSFNMGLSKNAFEATGGFGKVHPGEDPDLSLRLKGLGYKAVFIKDAFVYHKRRISWSSFFRQVYKFGSTRPILNRWHPRSASLVFWLPTLFIIGFFVSLSLILLGVTWPIYSYMGYILLAILVSTFQNKSISVGIQSGFAVIVQFLGYGIGFLRSSIILKTTSRSIEEALPKFFFK